ncbi:unnamed protein product, partial [Chrysoparadoxa australica]
LAHTRAIALQAKWKEEEAKQQRRARGRHMSPKDVQQRMRLWMTRVTFLCTNAFWAVKYEEEASTQRARNRFLKAVVTIQGRWRMVNLLKQATQVSRFGARRLEPLLARTRLQFDLKRGKVEMGDRR